MARSRLTGGILLGTLLIFHGLANSVLPLRGVDVPGPGQGMPGDCAPLHHGDHRLHHGGPRNTGVRPVNRVVMPAVWIAALAAPAAQLRAPYGYLGRDRPQRCVADPDDPVCSDHTRRREQQTDHAVDARRRNRRDALSRVDRRLPRGRMAVEPGRGARTPLEWQMTLPGDRIPRTPQLEIMHGVTIAGSSRSAVWPWLAQLGQDRAGFYSYDWLERAFGANVHNVSVIRPEWQARRVGEYVYATDAGLPGRTVRRAARAG